MSAVTDDPSSMPAGMKPQSANPALATAALAACLGVSSGELALIAEADADDLARLPAHATIGYAVDATSGDILAPGALLPAGRQLYASVRITLPGCSAGPAAVLDTLAALSANGWRFRPLPAVRPALDRSLATIRARPEDLNSIRGGNGQHVADLSGSDPELDGRGVLLGVVDFGCDFAHPAFLDERGGTRLRLLWDQNAPGDLPIPGAFREAHEINAALGHADPYQELGYWPDRNCYAPFAARGTYVVHGTHVLGVAAGRGVPGCPAGVAPAADLAFVHLRPGAMVSTGDPADVFDGVCAIFERADQLGMSAVVNLSLGANSGSHDGNTLYDHALEAVLARPGRAIAVAAGNERQARLNADGTVEPESEVRLLWRFEAGDRTENTLRIFSEAPGAARMLDCSVRLGGVELTTPLDADSNACRFSGSDEVEGMIYSGLASTPVPASMQQIEIRVRPSGTNEVLEIVLLNRSAQTVRFDAWIDRDDRAQASQSHFDGEHPTTASTLASTACGYRTLCVGAFLHRAEDLPAAPFSAEGTTRDGRAKPDVSAPGVDVLSAAAYGGRIQPGQVWRSPLPVRMSGSGAAAPHAAGIQALMLQFSPGLDADHGSRLLRETAALGPEEANRGWHVQLGCGRLDAAAALAKLAQ